MTTMFLRRGTAEEIAEFFRAGCANLRELLNAERLERERQVLRTEAGGRR